MRKRNVTRLLVGRQRRRRWTGLLRETVAQQLLRKTTQFELTIVSPENEDARKDIIRGGFKAAFGEWNGYALAALCVGLAATLAYGVSLRASPSERFAHLHDGRHSHRYLHWPRPVIAGERAELLRLQHLLHQALLQLLGIQTRRSADHRFLPAGLVRRRQSGGSSQTANPGDAPSAQRTANLYEFSRKIAAAAALEDVLWAAVHHVASTLQSSSLVLLPQKDGRLQIAAGYPPEDQLALNDWGAAEWAWEHGSPAGWKSETLPAANWLFLPMRTRRGMVGFRRIVQGTPACASAGPVAAAGDAGRPGRGRGRAHQPCRRYRGGAAADRDRAIALGAALVRVPRLAHPARIDTRLGDDAGDRGKPNGHRAGKNW